jgi:hypothetical protein
LKSELKSVASLINKLAKESLVNSLSFTYFLPFLDRTFFTTRALVSSIISIIVTFFSIAFFTLFYITRVSIIIARLTTKAKLELSSITILELRGLLVL